MIAKNSDRGIEIGLIGQEGMTGSPLAMGSMTQLIRLAITETGIPACPPSRCRSLYRFFQISARERNDIVPLTVGGLSVSL